MELSIVIDYRDKMRYFIPLIINIDTENMGLEWLRVLLANNLEYLENMHKSAFQVCTCTC